MAEVDLFKHSVIANDTTSNNSSILYFAVPAFGGAYLVKNLPPDPPAYAVNSKERDAILSLTPYVEGLWADAVRIATSRITSKGYEFDGPASPVERMQDMFKRCDGMNGFVKFMSRHLRDYFCTDNGAWIEIEREADKRTARIISFHHLDSLRCYRTGNPEEPIYYYDLKGQYHAMKWYQCFNVVDMASPRAGFFNSGLCAASRAYRKIRTMAAMDIYMDENITGGGHTAIEFIQGVTWTNIKDAVNTSDAEDASKGLIYYRGKLIVPALSDTPITRVSIPLKEIPAGFDREKEFRIAALSYTKAVGIPPHDLDPALTARGAMGIGAQAQIIEENVSGYGLGDWEKQFIEGVNELITPTSTSFAFITKDARDEEQWARVRGLRIANRAAQVTSGEITAQQAQLIAVDEGDLDRAYVTAPDVTADEQLDDTEKPEELTSGEAGVALVPQAQPSAAQDDRPRINLSPSQTQAILELVSKVRSGELDYDWAVGALQSLYGLDEQQARSVLGNPQKAIGKSPTRPAVKSSHPMLVLASEIRQAREALERAKR